MGRQNLKLFLGLLAALWILTLLIGCIERFLLHWPFVYWYPFFSPQDRFRDLAMFKIRLQHFGEANFFSTPGFPFTYPAPLAVIFHGFFLFGWRALEIYFYVSFTGCVCGGAILAQAMHRRGLGLLNAVGFVGASFVLSYPFWFLADRANIEIVNWLALALGVTCYFKKFWLLAASFFGLAAAMKIYPFVYIALLLSARRYAATAWSLVVAAAATAGSTFLIGPSFLVSAAGIASGLAFIRTTYILRIHPAEIGFDHSLFALIKKIALASATRPGALLDTYMVLAAAFGLGLYAWRIRNLPCANQVLALTVCAILLPPLSADYTLMNLYIPWAVLVLIAVSGDRAGGRGLTLSLACMAVLMAPESYLFLHGVRIAGQFKAVVLMSLLAVSVMFPVEEQSLPERGDASPAGL